MSVTHTRVPFADLVFLGDNPRTRTPEGLQQMAADIQTDPTFFDNRPVLVNLTDGTHQVYAGDLRAHAAHDVLGWADIPCNVERDVPPDVMRRRAIIDNLHRETWAPDILTTSWATDDLAGWGLTPDKWGDDAAPPDTPAGGYTASEDDYEPPAEIVTDIVPGDLFDIGPHRLLCGDSTNADDVAKVMGGEKADLVFTDPPYQLETFGGGIFQNSAAMRQIRQNGVDEFDPSILVSYAPTSIFFHNKPLIKKYIELSENWGQSYDLAIYHKRNIAPNYSGHLMTDVEYIAIIGEQDPIKGFEKEMYSKVFSGGKDNDNVLSYSKPVAICAKFLNLYSENSILDPFLGSGTTMVAAHQLHRRCFGIEIDPKYCQVILDRMLKLDPTLTITRNGKKLKS